MLHDSLCYESTVSCFVPFLCSFHHCFYYELLTVTATPRYLGVTRLSFFRAGFGFLGHHLGVCALHMHPPTRIPSQLENSANGDWRFFFFVFVHH